MLAKVKNHLNENVLLVDSLRHNLLSISQLCDKDYKVLFDNEAYYLYDWNTNSIGICVPNTNH